MLALLPPSPAILDLGCGSGEPLARYLIAKACAVTGIDTSPTLIAMAQQRFPRHAWHVADMRNLTLDRLFNGIMAWDSFFHLTPEDQRLIFPLFRRHAAPRAALLFTSGPAHGIAMGAWHGQPLYHASLAPGEYSALLEQNGFRTIARAIEDPACGNHTVWLAQRL